MKIYQVFHEYSVDGGFGDAVYESDLIETFLNEEDAKAFVKEFEDGHCYDKPYDRLYCGGLEITEIEIKDHFNPSEYDRDRMWWFEDPGCGHCSRRDECPDRR